MENFEILNRYYQNASVRSRVFEFLGGTCAEDLTAKFITADNAIEARRRPRPVGDLLTCTDQGMEICRSLWDREMMVAHLDIEYVNFDFPGEAYLHPKRIFALQAPVVEVTEKLLAERGIHPLHILSGRGHHFAWQIAQDSAAFASLVEIGEGAPSALQLEPRPRTFDGQLIPPRLIEGFAGLGLVMELLAHEIKEQASPVCAIPVELTAVEVGPSEGGREMISIDISEYGDPLHVRATRVPFSIYLKPWQQREAIGHEVVETLSPIFFIPLDGLSVAEGIRVMRDPQLTIELAGQVSALIPAQEEGTAKLIGRYVTSELRQFHEWYYSHRHDLLESWPETYDRTPMDALPACARLALDSPNDLLLRPSGMRLVTRVMLALGWHPRHIAGLIRSKFERDYAWGDQWEGYDPAMRADFYTRVFAGLFVTGRDDLVDFNCQSSKEERTCPLAKCAGNIEIFRQSAMTRRRYGYLAHRPFNRLLLQNKHL